MEIQMIAPAVQRLCGNMERVVLGKTEQIRLVTACMLAGGHVLLEDVPGTGKTMLAKALAKSVDGVFGRVQFTPDLLPSELTGINFYSPKTGEFSFRQGSLFANILLADEINRATPRTQSGLLESMEELQVSVDGTTYPLPSPYFVIATQNPVETQGTFPLPEAQLDRFLIQLGLGYPSLEETVSVLQRFERENPLDALEPVCTAREILEMRQAVRRVYVHPVVYRYIAGLGEAARSHQAVSLGPSTRCCLALARLSQAVVAIEGRDFVTPDDVKGLVPYVFPHRLLLRGSRQGGAAGAVTKEVLAAVPTPVENWCGPGQNKQ